MRYAIFSLFLLVLLISCATTKTPLPTDNIDEIVGTWINPDYSERTQKIVVDPDGVYASYYTIEGTVQYDSITLKLIEKWADSKGNVYCKIRADQPDYPVYELNRISNAGTVMEYIRNTRDFPTQIDPDDLNYRIYFRQQ